MWLNGKTVSSLVDIPEVLSKIERLESELNRFRQKDHEYNTEDYMDGELARLCKHFLSAFGEFMKVLEPS